jgi:hypothetical protein
MPCTIVIVLGIMWFLSFTLPASGPVTHSLLFVAAVALIIKLLSGRWGSA